MFEKENFKKSFKFQRNVKGKYSWKNMKVLTFHKLTTDALSRADIN